MIKFLFIAALIIVFIGYAGEVNMSAQLSEIHWHNITGFYNDISQNPMPFIAAVLMTTFVLCILFGVFFIVLALFVVVLLSAIFGFFWPFILAALAIYLVCKPPKHQKLRMMS